MVDEALLAAVTAHHGTYRELVGTYDAPPRPQVVFVGYEETDPQYAAMAAMVPSTMIAQNDRWTFLVREAEWDVYVTNSPSVEAPGFMHVLALGANEMGFVQLGNLFRARLNYGGHQASRTLHVNEDLPTSLQRLVTRDLVPWLRQQTRLPYLQMRRPSSGGSGSYESPVTLGALAPDTLPFVWDADGNVIAGDFPRADHRDSGGRCWVLPFTPTNAERWFATALADWHEKTPDRVPSLPDWRSRPRWRTSAEAVASDEVQRLETERDRLLQEMDRLISNAEAAAQAETIAADASLRRLLTAQAGTLVDVVASELRRLGFQVRDMDESRTDAAAKVEDLRVADPDDTTWTNVTEVRGYANGDAKAADLARLARFATFYVQETGALPVSRWYIVNQAAETDPDARRRPLSGASEDLDLFAEDGGLVIDTRSLFDLIRAVDDGHMEASAARRLLRSSSRLFDYPPPSE